MNEASSLASHIGSRRAGRFAARPFLAALVLFAATPEAADAALIGGNTDRTHFATRGAFVFEQQVPDETASAGVCDLAPVPALTDVLEAGRIPHDESANAGTNPGSGAKLNNVAFPNLDRLGPRNGSSANRAPLAVAVDLDWLASSIDDRSIEPAVRKTNIPALDRFRARILNIDRCQSYLRFLLQQINKMLFSPTQDQGQQSTYRYLVTNMVLFAFHSMNGLLPGHAGSTAVNSENASIFNLSNTTLGAARNTIAEGSGVKSKKGDPKKLEGRTYRDKKITIREVLLEIVSRTYIYFVIIIIVTIALFLRYRVR